MHVHMHIGFRDETAYLARAASASGGETVAAVAGGRPRPPNVEPLPLAATDGSLGSPAWVGVDGERVHGRGAAALTSALRRRCRSVNACGNVVSGRTRATDGMFAR